VVASNDQGFAGLLRYARDLGCLGISVGATLLVKCTD
jgi:hypothetical protein